MLMKMIGVDTEISLDVSRSLMLKNAALNKPEGADTAEKTFMRVYFPEMKSQDEKLMREAERRLGEIAENPIARVTLQSGKALDPRLVNTQLQRIGA